jgi:hypothetical protein
MLTPCFHMWSLRLNMLKTFMWESYLTLVVTLAFAFTDFFRCRSRISHNCLNRFRSGDRDTETQQLNVMFQVLMRTDAYWLVYLCIGLSSWPIAIYPNRLSCCIRWVSRLFLESHDDMLCGLPTTTRESMQFILRGLFWWHDGRCLAAIYDVANNLIM